MGGTRGGGEEGTRKYGRKERKKKAIFFLIFFYSFILINLSGRKDVMLNSTCFCLLYKIDRERKQKILHICL